MNLVLVIIRKYFQDNHKVKFATKKNQTNRISFKILLIQLYAPSWKFPHIFQQTTTVDVFFVNIFVKYSNVYVYQTLYKYVKVLVYKFYFEYQYYTHLSFVYIFQILILQQQWIKNTYKHTSTHTHTYCYHSVEESF